MSIFSVLNNEAKDIAVLLRFEVTKVKTLGY